MTKMKVYTIVFFLVGVGVLSAQNSAERLVREYENSLYNLEANVERVVQKNVCTDNDWYMLGDYVRMANNAWWKVAELDSDELGAYESRLLACRRKSKQIFEKAKAKAQAQQVIRDLLGY